MKFLIQKIDNKVVHDFSFTLLESIRYQNWLQNEKALEFKYFNTHPSDKNWFFKPFHQFYIPVGTVEFVTAWFQRFHDHTPKPINVPNELRVFAGRSIWNADENGFYKGYGKLFVKSNDRIKGIVGIFNENEYDFPAGNYQFSEVIKIDSEWRCFVYQNKLVGLQNYSGDFTMFPNVSHIEMMIKDYKSAPVAYTLDVGVFNYCDTFVIEVHDFFSCGLYGFADHSTYPYMLTRWNYEYLRDVVYGK